MYCFMDELKLKIVTNKRNNQLITYLNRKDLGLKGKTPKFLRINEENIEF